MVTLFQLAWLDDVMRLWLNGNIAAHPFIPKAVWLSHFDEVKQQIAKSEVYVYRALDENQGFVGLVQGGYLAGLFVGRQWQGSRVGKTLLNYCKQQYAQLTLNVFEKNQQALGFYQCQGFREIGRQQVITDGEWEIKMKWGR